MELGLRITGLGFRNMRCEPRVIVKGCGLWDSGYKATGKQILPLLLLLLLAHHEVRFYNCGYLWLSGFICSVSTVTEVLVPQLVFGCYSIGCYV